MKIYLLRTFGGIGFKFERNDKNEILATDGKGNVLEESVDFRVEEKDKTWPITVIQANGLASDFQSE